MTVIDPGHDYYLDLLDGGIGRLAQTRLTFVKREGPGYPGNVGSHPGVNLQEVLRALIDRVKYLDRQIACSENRAVLLNLRAALHFLEVRAARRHNRPIPRFPEANELSPFCHKCGHVGCEGECRIERATK